MGGWHRTHCGDWEALWRLEGHRILISSVRSSADSELVVAVSVRGGGPDLVEMRERFPQLTELWDAVRRDFWASLSSPGDQCLGTPN